MVEKGEREGMTKRERERVSLKVRPPNYAFSCHAA